MATSKRSKPASRRSTSANPSFRGFLNMNLTDEDKAIIKSVAYDMAAWSDDIEKWIDSGFKFTFSEDTYNHCHQVIGQRVDKDHVDYGIMLTGRGSTPVKAFKQWVYIQSRLVGDADWTSLLDDSPRFEIDD